MADTSDMIGMHRVFRAAFGANVTLLRSSSLTDPDGVASVATYYDNVLRLLAVHHDGEDSLITPLLTQRCSADERALVERVAGQHESVQSAITEAADRVAAWAASPTDDTTRGAVLALERLDAGLSAHLDDEELTLLPIAGRYLTAPEWGALPAHGMQHFTGDKLWLVLGLIREQMTAQQIAAMDAHMPPAARELWTREGRPNYVSFVAALRT